MQHIAHDPKNPAWWQQQARDLRARARKAVQIDSIMIFLKEADDCDRSAAKLLSEAKAAMPAACPTPTDCRGHGCHGDCLTEGTPA